MTDMELAEEIQAQQDQFGSPELTSAQWDQIVIALRRVPKRIDAKMAELLVDTTWRKAVGQCLGENCGRLFISRERFDEHIAPLIRQPEHPPSSEIISALKMCELIASTGGSAVHCVEALRSAAEILGREPCCV